jgi:hypothetical protein
MNTPPTPNSVRLGKAIDSPLDVEATKAILQQAWTGENYKCPKCDYATEDANLMLAHLVEEINQSLVKLKQLTTPPMGKVKES